VDLLKNWLLVKVPNAGGIDHSTVEVFVNLNGEVSIFTVASLLELFELKEDFASERR
jgi:hypothetical protein